MNASMAKATSSLRADSRLALRHHRMEEAGGEDSALVESSGKPLRDDGVVDHHRDNRRSARQQVESCGGQR
jgi:hypothetical protein